MFSFFVSQMEWTQGPEIYLVSHQTVIAAYVFYHTFTKVSNNIYLWDPLQQPKVAQSSKNPQRKQHKCFRY